MSVQDAEPEDANGIQEAGNYDCHAYRDLPGNKHDGSPVKQVSNSDADKRCEKRLKKDCKVIQPDFRYAVQEEQGQNRYDQVAKHGAGSCAQHVDLRDSDKSIVCDDFYR